MASCRTDDALIEKLVNKIREARDENLNILIVNNDDASPWQNAIVIIADHPDFTGKEKIFPRSA